jgi:hypothetical protein
MVETKRIWFGFGVMRRTSGIGHFVNQFR